MNQEVTDYINNAEEEQQKIMTAVRALIHESVEGVEEAFKWSRPVFSKKKGFAYLLTTKSHVNLGFMDFHKINDPKNLLEGTGKDMRHIKIKKAADIDAEMLKEWFVAVSS